MKDAFSLYSCDCVTDELLRILVRSAPAEYSLDFYQMYLNLVLSVFHMVCRNLSELQHLVSLILNESLFHYLLLIIKAPSFFKA